MCGREGSGSRVTPGVSRVGRGAVSARGIGKHSARDADDDRPWRRDGALTDDGAGSHDRVVADVTAQQHHGVGAQMAVVADAGWLTFGVGKAACADDPAHRRVGVDLDAAREVAPLADRQSATSVEHRERPDPTSFANIGLADDPGVWVLGVGR